VIDQKNESINRLQDNNAELTNETQNLNEAIKDLKETIKVRT